MMIDSREEVKWFAGEMEKTLRENDHKGGWNTCSQWHLIGRLREETIELEEVLHRARFDKTRLTEIIKEATDVANFAMMIADNALKELGD
ncbi:hypothetical protein REC12_20415 [Desulfosporosinus sp. PR]|uniref:hypothetical protein n=1 Tax=Candidatus Desulfosporosinus nitrosoreducens TaxID=3401928 RepID=UPI0027FA19DE|nr:hypothetical protein [Desulfosporosinus sp. PR]MDQ7095962.1 hypothetical protein [Desulfosporosinus sp. PR]